MTIPKHAQDALQEEQEILSNIVQSLIHQRDRAASKLVSESGKAKELTQSIMNTQREEDKALLASDEAVAHGIRDQKRDELETLNTQIKKPYFARIELLEDDERTGTQKKIEYKLGFFANSDCRIIDWRKAPISKLYYEYKEGEEYSEEILGKERNGTISLRNRVEIEKSKLVTVQNKYGTFSWNPKTATWESGGDVRKAKSYAGQLPEILSLITAEQFRTITEDASTAVLIQGVAGSGKTTVAIHRLAWMLHHENSSLSSNEITFLVLSPSLRAYVQNSLPAVGMHDVSVRTYHEWAGRTIKYIANNSDFKLARPIDPCPLGIERIKRSMALLKAIEIFYQKQTDKHFRTSLTDLQTEILTILKDHQTIIDNDETHLIDKEIINQAFERTKRNNQESLFDQCDDALYVRMYQIKTGRVVIEDSSLGKYGHIFVDEVQDFSPIELSTILGSVKNPNEVTLVGDTSQNLDENQSFPGWEKLQKYWNLTSDISKYVRLDVSHRSTLPIMRLADHIQQRSIVKTGRQGRVPIWFHCIDEQDGIGSIIKWLKKAVELYPNALAAVITATSNEAKFAYKMLQPTFGPIVRLGDALSFSFEEGILVTDVKQVKGLEFFSVLLWNPSNKSYPNSELGRNLLYVAVTRAEENLCLVTWDRQHSALPHFGRSKLVRSMDMTIKEEDSSNNDD